MGDTEIRVCGRVEELIKASDAGLVALLVTSFFVEEYNVRWCLYGDPVSVIIRDCGGKPLAFGYIFDVAPATPYIMQRYLPLSGGYASVKEWVADIVKRTGKIPSHVVLISFAKGHIKLRMIKMKERSR